MSSTAFIESHHQTPAIKKKSFLQPAEQTAERATGQIPFDSISRSYGLMRTFVGILGLALPAILLIGDYFFLGTKVATRGSLSAYYHSGMRDFFVSILAVVGILLFTYKITERNRDNALSVIAGIAAVGVAIFPTGIPSGINATLTPIQDKLGEDFTAGVHYFFAACFIVSLGILCYDFANRERKRPQQRVGYDARFPPEFWYRFHLSMAIAIACAVVFIIVTQSLGVFDKHSILIGETVVTVAFGLSWLAKGLDRNMLPKMTNW
jgi:hypothetical protein